MRRYAYVQLWNGGDPLAEHREVYKQHHGPIPYGWQVHHLNEKPSDNDPGNLEALSPGDHKKTHSKRYIRRADGGWDKICHTCGVRKPLTEFHAHNSGTTHRRDCKPCRNRLEKERLEKAKQKGDT